VEDGPNMMLNFRNGRSGVGSLSAAKQTLDVAASLIKMAVKLLEHIIFVAQRTAKS